MNLRYIFAIVIICFCNIVYADVDIQISSDKVALGDRFTVAFNLNGSTNITPDFSPLEKDFIILSTRHGNYFNMFNGSTSTQSIWQLTLEAKRAGELVIPSINFGNDQSNARKILVEATTDKNSAYTQNQPVFIKALVSNTKPYVQSQVLYTIRVYYQVQLENLEIELPKVQDAMLMQVGDGRNYQTTYQGKEYYVAEKNFALFPQKAGDIIIPATRARAIIFEQGNSLNYPFYISQPKSMVLSTENFRLNAQAIPTTYPAKTWLPAKDIKISEQWSVPSNQWETGNPVTRTIKVEAEGLRADQIPDFVIDKIGDINVYIDNAKRDNIMKDTSIVGVLEQKITYIPNSAYANTIPELKLDWWNTQTNTHSVAQLSAVNITIKAKISKNTNKVTPSFNPPAAEVIQVKPVAPIITEQNHFYRSIWFWLALMMLVVWVITLLFIWQKLNKKTKYKPKEEKTKNDISIKTFARACANGDALVAQQFLLAWGKSRYSDVPLNLEKVGRFVSDENLRQAIKQLEESLYSKETVAWDGKDLFTAFKKAQPRKRFFKVRFKKQRSSEVLPPLNP